MSLVGFHFLNTRIFRIPGPLHQAFEEVNPRVYLRRKVGDESRRGVRFIKEMVPAPAVTTAARLTAAGVRVSRGRLSSEGSLANAARARYLKRPVTRRAPQIRGRSRSVRVLSAPSHRHQGHLGVLCVPSRVYRLSAVRMAVAQRSAREQRVRPRAVVFLRACYSIGPALRYCRSRARCNHRLDLGAESQATAEAFRRRNTRG